MTGAGGYTGKFGGGLITGAAGGGDYIIRPCTGLFAGSGLVTSYGLDAYGLYITGSMFGIEAA
jgi:hypothetical protein